MAKLKQLVSDTVIYGVSSILGRIMFVMLSPLYTNTDVLAVSENGTMGTLFTLSAFLLVFFGFGLETAFFRFALKEKNNIENTLSTALIFITGTTLLLGAICLLFSQQITNFIQVGDYNQLVQFVILIVVFDTLTSIPFAYLRAINKPVKFAFIKLSSIVLTILLNLFFLVYCPYIIDKGSSAAMFSFIEKTYNPDFGVGYVFLANVIGSLYSLVLLSNIFKTVQLGLDRDLLKKMLHFGWPIMLVLIGSMINEVGDRQLLTWFLPGGETIVKNQVGIYQNCYKLSVFLSLFIQAFRYAGEPFFFAKAKDKDSKETYATVLKYFTIFSLFGFLVVALNLNFLKHILLTDSIYFTGLKIVPILLMAYVFAGMYYNLSIWYKLTDNTKLGAVVALIGALVTIVLNIVFIPKYGYMASAWATFFCFLTMVVVGYLWGQKVYPVPYQLKAIVGYIVFAVVIYALVFPLISQLNEQSILRYIIQILASLLFIGVAIFIEKRNLQQIVKS